MKKLLQSILPLFLVLISSHMLGQSAGFNSTFAVLSINGGANTYYDLQATTANTDFNGANLGSFNSSNSLLLKGAEHNVYKCGGCDLTSTRIYYRVYLTGSTPGAFSNLNIGFSSGGANGCGGQDQQWANTGYSTNILAGLSAGNYTFEVYSDASVTCSGGTIYAGNLGANYKATFNYCGPTSGALPVGNYSIPGCFSSIASAVTYLNANGVSGTGTVQFDVAAGYTETAPSTGILLNGNGTAGSLATGNATTAIVFKKNGAGANPKITAPLWTAGGNTDGIIKIIGGDYITFDGFTLEENAGNTITATGVTNTMTEVGFGLFLSSASNGAQNNTIKNCTIALNANYPNAIGIFSTCSSSATNTALSATSTAGTNSFNKYYTNAISNVAYGFYLICQPITATVTESGNEIGGTTAGLGNTITFGNATASNAVWSRFLGTVSGGIVYRNGAAVNIANNTVVSNALAYTQSNFGGILISSQNVPNGVTYTANISNNNVSLVNNGIVAATGIDFAHGIATATHIANNNTIYVECGASASSSGINQGIKCQYTSADNIMSGNNISINQPGVGPFTAAVIFINANGKKNNLTVQSNVLQSTGSHLKTSNIIYGISHNHIITGALLVGGSAATANTISISRSTPGNNFVFGVYSTETASTPTSCDISYNNITLSNLSGGNFGMGIYNYEGNATTVKTVNNNTINISGTNTGVSNGLFLSNGIITASNNVINVSTGSFYVAGIDFTINGTVNQATVDNNTISLATSGISPTVAGINTSVTTVLNGFNITNNSINSISASAPFGNPTLFGIRASIGTNNIISGNTVQNISTAVGSGEALVFGIDVSGISVTPSVFGNKIYNLQHSFSGANSNVSGINVLVGTSTFTFYNNFISDLRAPFASSLGAVNGISCGSAGSIYKVYYNTIKLGSSTPLSGGANFGVKGVALVENTAATILDLRNNIININANSSGSGYSSCVAIASGVSGVAPVGFATSSNNNIYRINPAGKNYLFAQGSDAATIVNGFGLSGLTQSSANNVVNDTNFNATCGYYKTFMGGTLDSATYTEDNLVAGSVGTFAPSGTSFAENGAQVISSPSITTDFNNVSRTPTNDIGALQFSGTTDTYSNPVVVASVLIVASPSGQVLLGTSVTFTATPTNGGAFPTYQWSINNVNIPGETNATFTTSTLAENDSVTVTMVSDDNCATVPSVTSNAIVMDLIYPYDTNVVSTLCGSTLSTINQYVYANNIPSAQLYRFKVTDLTTNLVQIVDRTLRVFQITQLPVYAFDRAYKVEVAVKVSNVWQPYGNPCTVTTPVATSSLVNCGATLSFMNDTVLAVNVPYAIGYRFKITNTTTLSVDIIDRPIRDFRMSQIASPQYNTTYSVEVAVRNTDGNYMPYGLACNLTTPPVPKTQLIAAQCGATVGLTTTIFADNFVGATTYRFKVENASLGFSTTFDRPIRSFVMNQIVGLTLGQTYSVSVSIEVGTVFGPFGNVCTLTLPSGASRQEITEDNSVKIVNEFKAVAYPNPFAENFKLDVVSPSESNMQVRVYDMIGKLIQEKELKISDLESATIGDDFASGVYNIVVIQNENTKTLRVIKR